MTPRPPQHTLFPYTTLFRSDSNLVSNIPNGIFDMASWNGFNAIVSGILYAHTADAGLLSHGMAPAFGGVGIAPATTVAAPTRSEERRVGKECRYQWAA